MRDYEVELIAALVEGRLEDETEARALVASSEKHRLEYEAQKTALEALSTADPVSMTETEKAALHRDLWTALTTEQAPTKAKTPWYYRWSPVAASLLVVVGLFTVINQNSDDASPEAADLVTDQTVQTTEAAEGAAADGGADAPNEEATATFTNEAAKIRDGEYEAHFERSNTTDAQGGESDTTDQCLIELGLDDYVTLGELPILTNLYSTDDDATRTVLALRQDTGNPDTDPIAFVDVDGCELLFTDK